MSPAQPPPLGPVAVPRVIVIVPSFLSQAVGPGLLLWALPRGPSPTPTPSSTRSAGAAGELHYLKVLDQLLGLDLEVHLVLAMVPLQQLLIG